MTGIPQRSRIRATAWNYLGGSGSSVLVAIQSLVLIPIYLDRLGPVLYGAWLGSGEILAWLLAFDMGLPNLVSQRIAAAHSRGEESTVHAWFLSGLTLLSAVALLIAGGGFFLAQLLPPLMGLEGESATQLVSAFQLGCAATALTLMANLLVGYARGVQRTLFMNAVGMLAVAGNFAVALVLVLNGFGLMSIAWGLLCRGVILSLGGLIFLVTELKTPWLGRGLPLRSAFREALRLSPVTTAGSLSFAFSNQCELFVLATVGSPQLAAGYLVVRKAAEFARTFTNILSFACYAPFAHLVGTRNWRQIGSTYSALRTAQSTLAIVLLGGYVLLNQSFVRLWVGPEQPVPWLLTVLIALQFYVGAEALLANYLFRAAGPVDRGALVMTGEAVLRVAMLFTLFGLTSSQLTVPVAGVVTGTFLAVVSWRGFAHLWSQQAGSHWPPRPLRSWLVRAALLAMAASLALLFAELALWQFLLAGTGWVLLALLFQWSLDASLRESLSDLAPRLRRAARSAGKAS